MPLPEVQPQEWPPELVRAYTDRRLALVRLAYLITGNFHAAEEIVHDAFLSTARRSAQVGNVEGYLHVSVVNGSRGWLRRREVERRHATPTVPGTVTAPDELWDVLERLKPKQRTALVLRFYEGLPDAEIASVLGCRPPTVRTLIRRALAALRKEIER